MLEKIYGFSARRYLILCSVLLVLVGLMACTSSGGDTKPDIHQNIEWEWLSLTAQSTGNETAIPNPEAYTLVLHPDGTVTGKADCNNFAGTYSQENGFTITLGPSTAAFCGEASLDQQYLTLLASVAAGGPDGSGNLALETAGGAERMLFQDGGPAPES